MTASANVRTRFAVHETPVALSVGERVLTVGFVVSIVNVVMFRVLLTLSAASVTVMVQLEYVPALSVLKVIVFDQLVALVVELEHEPPYVILPASLVVKV